MVDKKMIAIILILISNFASYLFFNEFIQSAYFASFQKVLEKNCGKIYCDKVRSEKSIF